MTNSFDHLRSIRAASDSAQKADKEAFAARQKKQREQVKALGPVVQSVLNRLRDSALPRLKALTVGESWALIGGVPWPSVMVSPKFAEDGTIQALETTLQVLDTPAMRNIAAAHGVYFVSRDKYHCEKVLEHSADEASLTRALLDLLPAEYLRALLAQLQGK